VPKLVKRFLLMPLVLLALVVLVFWPRAAWAGELSGNGSGGVSGAQLFQNHCAGCHVNGGNILRRSKTLKLAALERNGITGPGAIATIAAQGRGQMSGYGTVLGDGGAEAVAAYVWAQAQAGWPKA
jgi:cytochrome c6